MDPTEYQKQAARTVCPQDAALARLCGFGPENAPDLRLVQVNHGLIGVANELGELTSEFQRVVFYGKPLVWEDFRAKVTDEGGDLLWHLCELFSAAGVRLEDVMEANVRKLRTRYPDKFDPARAAEGGRDRVKEADAVTGWYKGGRRIEKTPSGVRSVAEVERLRGTPVGCCERNADTMSCDCLSEAKRRAEMNFDDRCRFYYLLEGRKHFCLLTAGHGNGCVFFRDPPAGTEVKPETDKEEG